MTTPEPGRAIRRRPVRPAVLLLVVLSSATACLPKTSEPHRGIPRRVVSLVPTVTEILFAIGAGDRVVGISDYDTYPPEALTRPRVGALTNPNIEAIFALEPDLVIGYGTQSQLEERLQVAGIRQLPFVSGPTSHILESILELGQVLDLEDNASRVASEIDGALRRLRETRPENPPGVLLVHSRDLGTMGSFYTGGADSYFGELIDIAGGRNIFDDVKANAFQPTLEEVLEREPEVIVELLPSSQGGEEQLTGRHHDWEALSSVPAVRNGRVYVLAADYLLLTGPRLHWVARDLANVIREQEVSRR